MDRVTAAVERGMAALEALADRWAEEILLFDLLDNLMSVHRLNRSVPAHIRDDFIKRQREGIDAIVRQAFIEGAVRALDYRDSRDAAAADAATGEPQPTPTLGRYGAEMLSLAQWMDERSAAEKDAGNEWLAWKFARAAVVFRTVLAAADKPAPASTGEPHTIARDLRGLADEMQAGRGLVIEGADMIERLAAALREVTEIAAGYVDDYGPTFGSHEMQTIGRAKALLSIPPQEDEGTHDAMPEVPER